MQIDARGSTDMYVKSTLIMFGLATSFYASFFGGLNLGVSTTFDGFPDGALGTHLT